MDKLGRFVYNKKIVRWQPKMHNEVSSICEATKNDLVFVLTDKCHQS